MSQIRPKILLRYGRVNQPVRVPLIDLLVDAKKTFLTSDTASGVSSLTVQNIAGFAINQILLIGPVGSEGSEIIKTHAVTAPSGSTVTLASATVFPHSASTPIYIIPFDQLEVSNAATTAGVKTVLASMPVSLVADAETTDTNDTTNTSGYYFARFKNSITATFSSYSDPAPYGGYTQLSARSVIDAALNEINKSTSEVLSDEFAFQQLDAFQFEVLRKLKRWSFMESFDTDIGDTETGIWRVAAPTDLDDQNSNKSIYNFRIGRGSNLTYVDKEKWNDITSGVAHTTLASNVIVGASTLTLTASGDFPDSGTIQVADNQYTYTANATDTGILTLDTVSTTTNTAGDDVFFGASIGEPLYWTIFSGYLYVYPIISSDFDERNFFLDYYKGLTRITADSDVLVVPDPVAASYFLQWKFLKKLNNGEENAGSTACRDLFIEKRMDLIKKDTLGVSFRLRPLKNSLNEGSEFGQDDRRTRLGNFPDI